MSDQSTLPFIDPKLVDALDLIFPEQSASMHTPLDELRFKGGQRSVVHYLKARLRDQEDQPLTIR